LLLISILEQELNHHYPEKLLAPVVGECFIFAQCCIYPHFVVVIVLAVFSSDRAIYS